MFAGENVIGTGKVGQEGVFSGDFCCVVDKSWGVWRNTMPFCRPRYPDYLIMWAYVTCACARMWLYIKKLVFWLLWCHWHNKCLNAASSELPVTWLSHLAAISEDTSILSWYTLEEECTWNSRESVVVFQGIQGKTWFAKTWGKCENQKAVELFVKILLYPTLWILLWTPIYLRKLGDPNKTLCLWRVQSTLYKC